MGGQLCVVLITVNGVMADCLKSVLTQSHTPSCLIVSQKDAVGYSDNDLINKYENCHRNRNAARERALKTPCDRFLFLDDDVVLPEDAVSSLMRQDKEVLGGYYPILNSDRFVCGRWVADHTFLNFRAVAPGLRRTDMVGLGCAMISRRVLESIQFEAGTNLFCRDAGTGQDLIVGECGMFGNRVAELGLPMYMCGEVVCKHLARPNRRSGQTTTAGCQTSESLEANASV